MKDCISSSPKARIAEVAEVLLNGIRRLEVKERSQGYQHIVQTGSTSINNFYPYQRYSKQIAYENNHTTSDHRIGKPIC